ncbi:unnamed protein product [Rhizophagus irregularis]|nr:unnamed protein product [Rhizophagus irregularis]
MPKKFPSLKHHCEKCHKKTKNASKHGYCVNHEWVCANQAHIEDKRKDEHFYAIQLVSHNQAPPRGHYGTRCYGGISKVAPHNLKPSWAKFQRDTLPPLLTIHPLHGQEDLKETPGSPYIGTIPPRITSQGPSAVGNRTPYLMPTPSAGNVLVGLEPNRRPNYHKDIAPKTLPSIGPSSPEGPQVV